MAVHQCARFCTDPKLSHEKTMKHIGRYLAATRDKGITFKPDATGALDAYVDADFTSQWQKNHSHLRETVQSRTGYVIYFCGSPVLWTSKMKTEIAMSTTEAELMALSQCLQDLIPIRHMLDEIKSKGCIREIIIINQQKIFST